MSNVISCRVGLFDDAQSGFERLPQAGITHAEVGPPADGDYEALRASARQCGVTIATLATGVSLDTEETVREFLTVIDGAAAIDVPKIFCSVKAAEDVPRPTAIARLRSAATYAAERNVILCMETHPPFGTNGDIALQTITEVDSPGLRYNLDTANIYYYNKGTDTVSELRKVIDLVAAVHLKDTDGGYESANFPVVGTGIVDFAAVFKILSDHGFTGPYTFEVEGPCVTGLDHDQRVEFLKECVDHIRSIGAMD